MDKKLDVKMMGSAVDARVSCVNLCPAEAGLVPVGEPRMVAPRGMSALLRFVAPEGPRLLCSDADGKLQLFGPPEAGAKDAVAIGTRFGPAGEGRPLCAEFGGEELLVMYAGSLFRYSYPGLQQRSGGLPSYLPGLRGSGCGKIMVRVASRTLGGDMRTASALEPADARAVEADYRGAAAELLRQARAQCVYVQPVLARYVLEDAAGNALFTSPTVVVGQAALTYLMPLRCTASGVLEGYTLEADARQLQLTVPAGLAAAGVKRIRVLATPQLHTVMPDTGAIDLRLGHNAGTGYVAEVSVGLEPVPEAPMPGAAGAQTVAAVQARMAGLEHTVAVLEPVAGTHILYTGADADAATEYRTVCAALQRTVTVATANEVLAAAPHGFVADTVARLGDTLLWGGVAVRRYAGYPPYLLAASVADKSWRGYVAVEFADGHVRVHEETQSTDAPTSLQPLLSYPSADAVALTIGLAVAGAQPVVRRFALTPSADGRSAIWVAPEMVPFALTGAVAALTVPPDTDVLHRAADCVVAADVRAPDVALASARGFGTEIKRLLPAAAGTAAWDFGRERALVFSTGGIFTAAVNARRDTIARGRIDERGTASGQAVARGADGDVYAVASGSLLRVRANRPTTLLTGLTEGTRAAWDAVRRELWLLPPPGADASAVRTTVVCVEQKGLPCYRRDTGARAEVLDEPGGSLLSSAEGVADISRQEEPEEAVRVEWRSMVDLPARFRPRALSVDARATAADLRIGLDDTLVKATGALRSPLRLRVPHHPAREVLLTLRGVAGADFVLKSITLKEN